MSEKVPPPPPYAPGGPQNYQTGAQEIPPPPYSYCNPSSHYNSSSGPIPPPPGWSQQGIPPPPPHHHYGATTIVTEQPVMFPATQVIIVGGCPACRVGILEDEFSCLGVLCAILFFPIGILCCLALRDKRCTNCGAIF